MFTRAFLLDAGERIIWTFLQAAAAVIIVEQSFGLEVWKVALTAGGLAVVKTIAASQVGSSKDAAAGPQ
jgi:hypothetical protein